MHIYICGYLRRIFTLYKFFFNGKYYPLAYSKDDFLHFNQILIMLITFLCKLYHIYFCLAFYHIVILHQGNQVEWRIAALSKSSICDPFGNARLCIFYLNFTGGMLWISIALFKSQNICIGIMNCPTLKKWKKSQLTYMFYNQPADNSYSHAKDFEFDIICLALFCWM